MRLALSLIPRTRIPRLPEAGEGRPRPADAVAVVVLLALPALAFGVPALLGHPVMPGDDLTQNFPLRVLVGRQLAGGHLPLFDPYSWSGSPLLAGWNAAAAYPLTWLFAVLPATAAWTVNLIAAWATAGLGMYWFQRALRLGSLPSLLGALSFAFAGAMAAQVAHLGLIAGMSWAPLQLLAVLRISQARHGAARLRWTGVLAAAFGLTILAGEPRAVDDAGLIVVLYAAWQSARVGRRWLPVAGSAAAGLTLGVCLGAVQWLPGLAAVATSQRGASSMALFESGSLYPKWLLLMLVPDLLGGSGSLGQPAFFASYNLAEVTGYVGVFPLVAAAVMAGRLRLRPRPPEWAVWHVIALAGVALALGGRTPLGHLLVHVPFFADQRLQSRNILVTDLALAVLLAYWADQPFRERAQRLRPARRDDRPRWGARPGWETVLGVAPPLAMIGVVAAVLGWGQGLLRWLGVGPAAAGTAGRLLPWIAPYAVIGAGAVAFVLVGQRLPERRRARVLAWLVASDLLVFTVLAVVAVPGPGPAARPPARRASAATGPSHRASAAHPSATAPAAAVRPITALGRHGRFAIYDPGQFYTPQLRLLGAPDLNVISGAPSVQGYSSIVDGAYASATGSHHAMGEGQNVLSPQAIGNGTLDQLSTSLLLTLPRYLIAAPAQLPGTQGPGSRSLAARSQATWYLGGPFAVSSLTLSDPAAQQDAAAGARLGILTPAGRLRWFPATAAGATRLALALPHPATAVAVIAQAGSRPSRFGGPAVTAPSGREIVADGELQDALTPPRWRYAGQDGPFALFVDRLARGPITLQALPGQTAAGASVRLVAGSAADPTTAAVSSRDGVRVIRAVAAAPGWSATWRPRNGRTAALPVSRDGLVQVVAVPPGQGLLTWRYTPPGFLAGLASSLLAATVILLLLTGLPRPGRAVGPGDGAPVVQQVEPAGQPAAREPAA